MMELMDEIAASSSGLLSTQALKVCFMVHVRCGIIVLNTVSFPLVNTFRKTKLKYLQGGQHLHVGKRELPPFASVVGQQQGSFSWLTVASLSAELFTLTVFSLDT